MGIKALRKLQLGRESAMGTAVAATALWRGPGAVIEDGIELEHVDEDLAIISGADRTIIPFLLAKLNMPEVPATFEQLPYLFDGGIKTVAGVQDGAGTDYIYTYPGPTTAVNTIKTYTIEGGDDQEAERMEYSFVKDMVLKGVGKGAITMSANWVGRQVALNAFTGSIAVPTVESILFGNTRLYVDAVGGTIGTTQITGTLLGFTLNIKTGWEENFTADNNLYFDHLNMNDETLEITLEMTLEHNANAAAQKVNWRAQTPMLFRLLAEGSQVATPGTTYTYKTLILDMAGKVDKCSKLGEQNGNDIINVTVRARYNSTAALFFEAVVVNELAALI